MTYNKLPPLAELKKMTEKELEFLAFGSVDGENLGLDCNCCPWKMYFCGGECLEAIKEYMHRGEEKA